jgi:hypothetical protein
MRFDIEHLLPLIEKRAVVVPPQIDRLIPCSKTLAFFHAQGNLGR